MASPNPSLLNEQQQEHKEQKGQECLYCGEPFPQLELFHPTDQDTADHSTCIGCLHKITATALDDNTLLSCPTCRTTKLTHPAMLNYFIYHAIRRNAQTYNDAYDAAIEIIKNAQGEESFLVEKSFFLLSILQAQNNTASCYYLAQNPNALGDYPESYEKALQALQNFNYNQSSYDALSTIYNDVFGNNHPIYLDFSLKKAEIYLQKHTECCLNIFMHITHRHYKEAFVPALQAAQAAIKNSNSNIQIASLKIFVNLVCNDFQDAFTPALQAAIKNSNSEIQILALYIFINLVIKNFQDAFTPALEAAQAAINSSNPGIQITALQIFRSLVANNHEDTFALALAAAQNAIESNNADIYTQALQILSNLAYHGYKPAFCPALQAAQEAIENNNPDTQIPVLYIFINLVGKNYQDAFASAKDAAQAAIMSPDNRVSDAGHYLENLMQ